MIEYDEVLDVSGYACPMPLLKMKQRLNSISVGSVLYVVTTDKGSIRDFSAFLKQTEHALLDQVEKQGQYHFWIKKNG